MCTSQIYPSANTFNNTPEMYRMIQPNIRSGIDHASVQYGRANNKLLGCLYDPTKPALYILYMNATNLSRWAMSQPMLDDKIDWLSDQECNLEKIEFSEKQTCDQFFEYLHI